MDKRDLIIPARFDSRGAAAGLKAVGGGGHASGDLGQAAAVAADQFRRAHESVESALQEFNLLRRASGGEGRPAGGDPAADEAAQGAGAKFPAEDWLESREGLRGAAGSRLGGSGSGPMEGKTGGSPPLSTRRPLSQVEAGRPDASPGRSYGPSQAETDPTAAGGPAAPGSARAEGSSALESSNSFVLGLSGAPSGRVGPSEAIPSDNRPGLARRDGATRQAMAGDLQEGEIPANLRRRQGFAEGADDSGTEPVGSGGAGRTGQDAIADYAEWIAGGGDGGRDRARGRPRCRYGRGGRVSRRAATREAGRSG